MRNLLYLLFYVLLFSCSIQKNNNLNNKYTTPILVESKLTEKESNIINAFVDVELKKERYKNYKYSEIYVIEEALKKHQSLETYIFSRNEWNSINKINGSEDLPIRYFLDSLQIKKFKLELEKEELYHWKVSDFKNSNVSLLKYEDLRNIINTAAYRNFSSRLIIYLSRPLIIDENNALISCELGDGQLGFHSLNHFTVLMRKVNIKWEQSDYYYDGVFN
jgi:hypothetical protein